MLASAGLPRSAGVSLVRHERYGGAGLHCPHGAASSWSAVTWSACTQVRLPQISSSAKHTAEVRVLGFSREIRVGSQL